MYISEFKTCEKNHIKKGSVQVLHSMIGCAFGKTRCK